MLWQGGLFISPLVAGEVDSKWTGVEVAPSESTSLGPLRDLEVDCRAGLQRDGKERGSFNPLGSGPGRREETLFSPLRFGSGQCRGVRGRPQPDDGRLARPAKRRTAILPRTQTTSDHFTTYEVVASPALYSQGFAEG